MTLLRIIALLAVVILGSIAAEDLFKFLTSILPVLMVLTVVLLIGWGWMRRRGRL